MKYRQLQEMIDCSRSIVFFGGAGTSTESGIADYRSVDGLYSQKFAYPPETMLSHDFFIEHTAEFFDFYRAKLLAPEAKPNAAHKKLAELEAAGRLSAVITQNVDGLHQAAGSKKVLELHGSVHRNTCTKCGRRFGLDRILSGDGIPLCDCGGIIKPDVVLYGEQLDSEVVGEAAAAAASADMLIIGGTSMTVYPAAGLVQYFRGSRLAVINRSHTGIGARAMLEINDSIGMVLDSIEVKPVL